MRLAFLMTVVLVGATMALAPAQDGLDDEVEAFVQNDVATKLEALNQGELCCDDESEAEALTQAIDLGNGEFAVIVDNRALLMSHGAIFGLSMLGDDPREEQQVQGSDVAVDCELVGSNTMFCSYIWGNKIRVVIFEKDDDGAWVCVFDSGWIIRKQTSGAITP